MTSEKEQEAELFQTFLEVMQALICKGNGASDKLKEFLDKDFSGFGTTKDESFKDLHGYFNLFNQEPEQVNLNYHLHWSRLKISGTTGVIEGELDLKVQRPTEVLEMFTRLTFVFEKRINKWMGISAHFSFPSDNLAAGGAIPIDTYKGESKELEEMMTNKAKLLQEKTKELEAALISLKKAQNQLIQQEKLASLGELTAGIAHEIQNPLNFVNNFSEVSIELVGELQEELEKVTPEPETPKTLLADLVQNLAKIKHHGHRAEGIVKGMLMHSRNSNGQKEPTDINALVDEYLRLSYHGLRAKDKNFNATLITDLDDAVGLVEVVPQDLGRVLLNLFNNAFYAVRQKQQQQPEGYQPQVSLKTCRQGKEIIIVVRDNGVGIPDEAVNKIMQPFFTTKPSGEGTGLGLSLSNEIITQGHGGNLKVITKPGEFAEFIISLPVTT